MTLAVYLAGASRDLDRVLHWSERLYESDLVTITHHWWRSVIEHGVGGDSALSDSAQRTNAEGDLAGVSAATLFWALWPSSYSAGVPFEFAHARACGLRTVVSGFAARECIFTALADARFSDDRSAYELVLEAARSARRIAGGCPSGESP